MKSFKKIIACLIIIVALLQPLLVYTQEETADILKYLDDLDRIVKTAIEKSGTPGVSIAIVTSDEIQFKSYGYSNKLLINQVSPKTLFELGSMSKAFTALGILYLEQEGKLKLKDNIKDYIPWLILNYSGEYKGQKINGEVPVTIENVLYQTTGIPFQTIGYIPEGNSDDILEKTVRTLIHTELDFYPGTKYSYATINYDILGLIIQTVSGQSYESFINEKILIPLGLNNTYLTRTDAEKTGLFSAGYKTQFFNVDAYSAPEYRGNTPAGYVISSANDMARWMQIQMGLVDVRENYKAIIAKSHIGNSTVASSGNAYYAAGWSVHIRGETIGHGGSNPNFSSNLVIDNEKNIGICVLTNLNSNAAGYITDNFFNLLYNRKITSYRRDTYQSIDIIFSILCIGSCVFGIMFFILLIIAIIETGMKKRSRAVLGVKYVEI